MARRMLLPRSMCSLKYDAPKSKWMAMAESKAAPETSKALYASWKRALKSEGITVASIEQVENSVMLDHFSFESNKKLAIVFGNEVKGVQQEVVSESDYCIEIPQKGTKHSLNISVSCGVVLWDLSQKIK